MDEYERAPHPAPPPPSQGITLDTLELVSEVLQRVVPPALAGRLAFLSGPSFAAEVAAGLPTAVTVAAEVRERKRHQRHSPPSWSAGLTASAPPISPHT